MTLTKDFKDTIQAPAQRDPAFYQWGAMAAFAMPLCYVAMFIIFGVALSIPQTDEIDEKIAYVAAHRHLIALAYILGYLVFGSLLLITVQAAHARVKTIESHLLNSASLFGLIWVVLMLCSGMLALVGMDTMIRLHLEGSPSAATLFYVYTTTVNGLGGGIELVGGLWMLLLSIAAWRTQQMPKLLNAIGALVGVLGIITVHQGFPGLKEAFGIGQIIWFVGLAGVLLRAGRRALNGDTV